MILHTDQYLSLEKLSSFDIAQIEGSILYDEFTGLIKENNMDIENVDIKLNSVSYRISEGIFSSAIIDNSVYIITEDHKNTIIYAIIPNGVVLPSKYRPQDS